MKLKKHEFTFRMAALVLCTAIAISFFYAPQGADTAMAADPNGGELRGVWVATVANIDYPTNATTNPEELKSNMITILDNAKAMGFNAIFLQVRPTGDALYQSDIFPWSRYLTGTQGVAPDNGFDPLAFAVEEAHNRGLELHAWINPYRITSTSADNSRLAANNPAVTHPGWVVYHDDKMYYNPGIPDVIDMIIAGAVEIVNKYDVDGIHMDDYFYPSTDFDDDSAYAQYAAQYPNKADWRRSMVDTLVRCMHKAIEDADPTVEFGVSPAGIWANSDTPGGSATRGNSTYHNGYADTKGWVEKGYLDYIMPQLYWNIGYDVADYSVLSQWWANVCAGTGVRLYIGEGAYRTTSGGNSAWAGQNGVNELRTHVQMIRENPNISGYCMYTYNSFLNNSSIYSLMQEVNASAAQTPNSLDNAAKPAETPAPTQEPTEEPAETEAPAEQTAQPGGQASVNFQDMSDYQWAMTEVTSLVRDGIIKGRSDTEFAPDEYITRADTTAMLLRVLGEGGAFTDNFDDVYPDKYYYNEIGAAKAKGIAQGIGNNLFDPEGLVIRQDMATMAYRVLSERGVLTSTPWTGILNRFTDWNLITFYAQGAMAACVEAGLMSGYNDVPLTIRPQNYASRIEVALFTYRIQQLIKQAEENAEENYISPQ